jgi:hypothetical protein
LLFVGGGALPSFLPLSRRMFVFVRTFDGSGGFWGGGGSSFLRVGCFLVLFCFVHGAGFLGAVAVFWIAFLEARHLSLELARSVIHFSANNVSKCFSIYSNIFKFHGDIGGNTFA